MLRKELRQVGYLGSPGTLWRWRELWEAGKSPVKYAPVEMGIQGPEIIIAPKNWPRAALLGQAGQRVQTALHRAEDYNG